MRTDVIARAIRAHGFAKVAAEVMRRDGEYAPKDASLRELVLSATIKVARNKLAHEQIRRGLAALDHALGG